MLFLKQFLRRGAQLLFGGEDRAETSPSAAFVPTDIFPVAPSETLYVRCRLRVPTPSSDGLAAAAKNSVSARIRRTLPHHDGAHPHLKFDRRILCPKFPLPEKIRQKSNRTRILRSRAATGEYRRHTWYIDAFGRLFIFRKRNRFSSYPNRLPAAESVGTDSGRTRSRPLQRSGPDTESSTVARQQPGHGCTTMPATGPRPFLAMTRSGALYSDRQRRIRSRTTLLRPTVRRPHEKTFAARLRPAPSRPAIRRAPPALTKKE